MTDVFEAFHQDPWQRQKLEAFRVGTLVGYTPSPLVKDFRALKQEIADEGLFEVRRRSIVVLHKYLPVVAGSVLAVEKNGVGGGEGKLW